MATSSPVELDPSWLPAGLANGTSKEQSTPRAVSDSAGKGKKGKGKKAGGVKVKSVKVKPDATADEEPDTSSFPRLQFCCSLCGAEPEGDAHWSLCSRCGGPRPTPRGKSARE